MRETRRVDGRKQSNVEKQSKKENRLEAVRGCELDGEAYEYQDTNNKRRSEVKKGRKELTRAEVGGTRKLPKRDLGKKIIN